MAQANELAASGLAAETARLLGQTVPSTGLTATGSTVADAYPITTGGFFEFSTVSGSTGAQLPSATGTPDVVIFNGGGSPLTIYPQTGEYINGSQNGTFSITNGKSGTFKPSGLRWIANLSA